MLDSSDSWQYPLQILLPLAQGSDGQAQELSAPSLCRASPSLGRCRRVLGASDTTLQGGVPSGGSVQPDGGKGPGWERGMLWAPGPSLLGDCKIPMYITWLRWCLGALECNKARRTGLFPGAVVPLGKVHPSTVRRVGFVFGGRKALASTGFSPSVPCGGKDGGWGQSLRLAADRGSACEVCGGTGCSPSKGPCAVWDSHSQGPEGV